MKTDAACERMLAYMSGRYEDSFSDPVLYGGYPGAPMRQYCVSSEKLGEGTVKVEIRGRGTKEERYLDDYMGAVYAEELEETIRKMLTESFEVEEEDMAVLMEPASRGVSDHWTLETSFEEYCRDPAAGICFRAVIRSGVDYGVLKTRKTTEHWLEDMLFMTGICCTGWLYFVPEDTELEGLNEVSFFENILKHHYYNARLFFNMRSAEGVDEFSWDTSGYGPAAWEPEKWKDWPEDAAVTAAVDDD